MFFVDEVKVQLAKSELKQQLVDLIRATKGNSDEDSENTMKMSADLIVLLLTGGMVNYCLPIS